MTKPPKDLQYYHCALIQGNILISSNTTTGNTIYPLHNVISYYNLSLNHKCFNLKLSTIDEPTSYTKVISDPNWKHAIQSELQSLNDNKNWGLVLLPLTPNTVCVNGFSKLRLCPMLPSNNKEPGLLLRALTKLRALTILEDLE